MWNWNTMHALLKIICLHFQSPKKKKIEKNLKCDPNQTLPDQLLRYWLLTKSDVKDKNCHHEAAEAGQGSSLFDMTSLI